MRKWFEQFVHIFGANTDASIPNCEMNLIILRNLRISALSMKDKFSFTEFPNKSFKSDCDNKDKVCLCVKDTMEQEFGKEFLDSYGRFQADSEY